MDEKKFGFGLLTVGLVIMFITVLIVILVFTGNMAPINLFNIPAPTLDTSSFIPGFLGKGKEIEILPTASFNLVLNLGVEFLLMTFLMSFGFKLADLGVKLIRPLRVK